MGKKGMSFVLRKLSPSRENQGLFSRIMDQSAQP
jgi:hypothetical protein